MEAVPSAPIITVPDARCGQRPGCECNRHQWAGDRLLRRTCQRPMGTDESEDIDRLVSEAFAANTDMRVGQLISSAARRCAGARAARQQTAEINLDPVTTVYRRKPTAFRSCRSAGL